MVTPTTHGQTNDDAIEHDQTHKSDPITNKNPLEQNQQKPTAGAQQPIKIHRITTNKNPYHEFTIHDPRSTTGA